MTNFESILFKKREVFDNLKQEPPFFSDLNLNNIVNEITEHKQQYNLKPFFYYKLKDIENIRYRQEILKDIEKKDTFESLTTFADAMLRIQEYLKRTKELTCKYQKERWFLDAILLYCKSVINLSNSINILNLRSEGLSSFRTYLNSYINSNAFSNMYEKNEKIQKELEGIKYSIFIKENKVRIEKYNNETDYGKEILSVFERFKQNEVEDYVLESRETYYMNHIESGILKFVAALYKDIFNDLETYCSTYEKFLDKTIEKFNRDVQFYISYLEYIKPMEMSGLNFCYPEVSDNKNIYDIGGFDVALASKLLKENKKVVCNDFYLKSHERIFVVTGPNQGGKTTFARSFGQMHFLAALGLKIPGEKAVLFLFDSLFTHFEKEENIETLSGKLEDDLIRIKAILDKSTSESIIIMNEIFSSTTLKDALFLGKRVLENVIEKDSLCVFVTFLDELACISDKIVSLTSTVSEKDVTIRTYKIIRNQANGISYAISIAKKHCLNYECLSDRLKRISR